jgi:hypothetical protein
VGPQLQGPILRDGIDGGQATPPARPARGRRKELYSGTGPVSDGASDRQNSVTAVANPRRRRCRAQASIARMTGMGGLQFDGITLETSLSGRCFALTSQL